MYHALQNAPLDSPQNIYDEQQRRLRQTEFVGDSFSIWQLATTVSIFGRHETEHIELYAVEY